MGYYRRSSHPVTNITRTRTPSFETDYDITYDTVYYNVIWAKRTSTIDNQNYSTTRYMYYVYRSCCCCCSCSIFSILVFLFFSVFSSFFSPPSSPVIRKYVCGPVSPRMGVRYFSDVLIGHRYNHGTYRYEYRTVTKRRRNEFK